VTRHWVADLEKQTLMRPELYERVALRIDVKEHSLKKRDVALLIDRVPHPFGAELGVVVEICLWDGRGFFNNCHNPVL
jgi:hypothetical protein